MVRLFHVCRPCPHHPPALRVWAGKTAVPAYNEIETDEICKPGKKLWSDTNNIMKQMFLRGFPPPNPLVGLPCSSCRFALFPSSVCLPHRPHGWPSFLRRVCTITYKHGVISNSHSRRMRIGIQVNSQDNKASRHSYICWLSGEGGGVCNGDEG